MPWPRTRSWALLAAALLAAGFGLSAVPGGPGPGWSTEGRLGRITLATEAAAPFEAVVPTDAGRVLLGRPGKPIENPGAGLPAVVLVATFLLPVLRPAFGPARSWARSTWLSPGRRSAAVRAPPRSRLV